jgi:tetratricopeptide (TPR) repeat protein
LRLELAHDPSHAQAYAWLGDLALRRDDPKAAKSLLEKAVRLGADIRIAHLDLGILYAKEGLQEKAVAELREAERLDPAKADAHYRLGRVYKAMGRRQEAQPEMAVVKRLQAEQAGDALHKVSGRPPALPVP